MKRSKVTSSLKEPRPVAAYFDPCHCQAYLRYFLGPLRKPATLNGNAGLGIQWLGGLLCREQSAEGTDIPGNDMT